MADNRIAYGLAKEHGIDTKDMSPKQVWEALKGKGVTQESVDKDIRDKEQGKRQELEKKFNDDLSFINKRLTQSEKDELDNYKVPKDPVKRNPEDAKKWEQYDKDYEIYVAKEKEITSDMQNISKLTKMPLIGLEYSLKSKDSYDRKVNDKRIKGEYKPIGDAVRYTFEHSMNNAPKQIQNNINELKEKGYKIISIDNKWKDDGPYNGINIDVVSPQGVPIEIQYLTHFNHLVKEDMHKYYEISRDNRTPPKIKQLAERKMRELAKKWKIPKNIKEI